MIRGTALALEGTTPTSYCSEAGCVAGQCTLVPMPVLDVAVSKASVENKCRGMRHLNKSRRKDGTLGQSRVADFRTELAPQEIVVAASEPPESGSSSEEEAFSSGIGSRQNEWNMAVALSELRGRVPGEATEKSIL